MRTDMQPPQIQLEISHGLQAQIVYQNGQAPEPTCIPTPAGQSDLQDVDAEQVNYHKKSLTANDAANAIVFLQQIATPGFTDRLGQQEILATVRDVTGVFNCYATLQNASVTGDILISASEFATVGSTILSGLPKADAWTALHMDAVRNLSVFACVGLRNGEN
eukprot:935745-Rhodomonas_salina.1